MKISLPHSTHFIGRLAGFTFVLLAFSQAIAQSSVFNVPTTDTLPKGEKYIEAAVDLRIARSTRGGWQSYGFFGVYGASNDLELGLNAYSVRTSVGFEPLEFQPNIKYKIYNNEKSGVSAAVGAIGYIPALRAFRQNADLMVYGTASKNFTAKWSPRLTGGAYQTMAGKNGPRSSRGFLVAIEQPISKRLTLMADWNSGKNRHGYAASGISFAISKRRYLSAAYYFGNEGRGNNFLGVYYGVSF